MARTKSDTQRVGGKTADAKTRFLIALAEHVTVLASCKAAGVGRSTVYQWRDEDPEFAAAFREVDDANVEAAEAVLYELAVTGRERVKVDKDGNEERWTERDPQLLQFFLKARRPAVYRDRATVEHTGPEGGPVQVQASHDLSKLSADELRAYLDLTRKAEGQA
jgi:hypothetical protein